MSNRASPTLPKIEPFDANRPLTGAALVFCVGFEDRSIALLKALGPANRPDYLVPIVYSPKDPANRLNDVTIEITRVGIPEEQQLWLEYDRYIPDNFESTIKKFRNFIARSSRLVVDISGMSKLLIILILEACKQLPLELSIIYAEAEVYHPTKDEFEEKKRDIAQGAPTFLTGDVFALVGAWPFSTVTMQGQARLMIAFPTFNPREMLALVNELSLRDLILLEGRPHLQKDQWRTEAIRELNSQVEEMARVEKRELLTFDYAEVAAELCELYELHGTNRKMLVAPTGSKLQTVGVFMFLQEHPDVQVVYPVTEYFLKEYTEGAVALWQIKFDDFAKLASHLAARRWAQLDAISRKLQIL